MQPVQEAHNHMHSTQYSYSNAERAHHGETLKLGAKFVGIVNVLVDMGKPEEALDHVQKGIEMQFKVLGNEHVATKTRENTAIIYRKQGPSRHLTKLCLQTNPQPTCMLGVRSLS